MIVFFYEKVRLKRGVWQTVSIVLLIAFLCAFFTLFDGFICQKEQDMESAYAVIPVQRWQERTDALWKILICLKYPMI